MKKFLLSMLSVLLFNSMSMANKRVMTQEPGRQLYSQTQMMQQAPVAPTSVEFAEAEDETVTENVDYLAYCSEDVWEVYIGEAGTVSMAAYFPADIVKRLVGNKLTGIAFQVWDDNAENVHVWVSRDLYEEPFIDVKVEEGFPTFQAIRVDVPEPYELKEEGLYIGMTMDCPDAETAAIANDWTDRDNAFYYKAPGSDKWEDRSHRYYGSFYILGITTGEKLYADEDVEIRNVIANRGLCGKRVSNQLNFYNYGRDAVTSIEVEYITNGVTKTVTETCQEEVYQFSSGSIAINVSLPEDAGHHDVAYRIVSVNGNPNADNGAACDSYLVSFEESFPRMVFIEQTETTEDEWSSVSNLVMTKLNDEYTDKVVAVAAHQDYPYYGEGGLTCDSYEPLCSLIGYPYGSFINRKYLDYAFEMYYDYENPTEAFRLASMIDMLYNAPTEGKIEIKAQYANEEGTEIRFDSDVVFNYNSEKEVPYRVAYILAESEVEFEYMLNRFNYEFVLNELFYGDSYEFDYYWSTLPPEIVALGDLPYEITEDVKYLNVARGIYDCFGVEGSLVGKIVKDETKKHTYTVSVPETVADKSKLFAVAVLLDGYSGEALNVVKCEISDYSGVAAVEGGNNVSISVENGNPFVKTNAAATVEVYNLAGQKLASATVDGSSVVPVDTADTIVIVRAVTGNDVTVKRVVLK